jgi:YVTN family beta-propeller protein
VELLGGVVMYMKKRFGLLGLTLATAALMLSGGIAAAAAPKAYIGNFADNTVSAVDTATGTVVATIPVVAGPHGIAMSRDGRTVYVSGDGSSAVSVIDTATDRVVQTIAVGKSPNGIALTPDGRFLLVAVYGEDRIGVLDTTTKAVVGSIAAAKPHTISIAPDGKLAYITSQEPGKFALLVVDLQTRAIVRTVALEKTPRDGEFSYDGKTFYFTEAGIAAVQVLDPATDRVVAEIPTGISPHTAQVFRGATLGLAVIQGPGELLVFDPATRKALRTIAVGKQPHWLAVSGDQKTAYVTNEGSNDLSIVDLASGGVRPVAVGNAPRKVVVQADAPTPASAGAKVSIAGFAFGPQRVSIRPGEAVTWTNDDGAAHTVTFKDGSAGSASLAPGRTFNRVFEKAGTYEYFCSFHPYMTGQVVVR